MSMTRAEIIEAYESAVFSSGLSAAAGNEEAAKDYELLKAGLDALRFPTRETVEKVWRGEWKPTESPYMNECEDCSVCGYRTPWGHGFRFCPACGRAMTDEAIQMVMERLETLNDADTNS